MIHVVIGNVIVVVIIGGSVSLWGLARLCTVDNVPRGGVE